MKAVLVPTYLSEVKRAKFLCLAVHTTMLYPVTSSYEFNLYSFQKLKRKQPKTIK